MLTSLSLLCIQVVPNLDSGQLRFIPRRLCSLFLLTHHHPRCARATTLRPPPPTTSLTRIKSTLRPPWRPWGPPDTHLVQWVLWQKQFGLLAAQRLYYFRVISVQGCSARVVQNWQRPPFHCLPSFYSAAVQVQVFNWWWWHWTLEDIVKDVDGGD